VVGIFFNILRYLHCCPVQNQDHSADDYDPSYKIAKVRDYLENRYLKLFVPGQQLSLDETLIRAFGRIKFKVRIVTKAARYGIKVYVITDAATAFVLRVVIYTGKTTYYSNPDSLQDRLKTVQVVNCLVKPFVGTHRTIYIDCFYTSLDLLKSLALANRIPQGIRHVARTSQTFKQMKRGDALKCRVWFRTKSGQESQAGLVCWRDWNMVSCLSKDSINFEFDECSHRGLGGIIWIPRPVSLANYNKYMGGVDFADMRRLHCNSTIKGQNRWWLKLFSICLILELQMHWLCSMNQRKSEKKQH
jgi:Transposase IS4